MNGAAAGPGETLVGGFREVLDAIGSPASSLELAEMLWLARYLPAAGQEAETDGADRGGEEPRPGEPSQQPDDVAGSGARDWTAGKVPVRAPGGARGDGASDDEVRVPAASALDQTLKIQRALRPLKRRVPSAVDRTLDEEITADQIARQMAGDFGPAMRAGRPWTPVLSPARERWLSLAIVFDTGPAMPIWRPLAREFREAMFRLGAFRDVRMWDVAAEGGLLGLRAFPGGPLLAPKSIIDPTGRQAVILLSDCSGEHWWKGDMAPVVHQWARYGPAAILQPLPERLWRRTAVRVVSGKATLPRPGAPNSKLHFVPHARRTRRPPGTVPVPVIEVDRDWLGDWALLVAAANGPLDTAVTFLGDANGAEAGEPVPAPPPDWVMPGRSRVRRFHTVASPDAMRLAAHVAVTDPYLPVMRLIQKRVMDPPTGPKELAEFLLSGLLVPHAAGGGRYEFVDGAREALLERLPRDASLETARTVRSLSAEIEMTAGAAMEAFVARVPVAPGTGHFPASSGVADFAYINERALRLLSYDAIPVLTAGRALAERATAGAGAGGVSDEVRVLTAALSAAPSESPARRGEVTVAGGAGLAGGIAVTVPVGLAEVPVELPPAITEPSAGLPAVHPDAYPLGRDAAVAAILDALDPEAREPGPALVTGPSGVGKTTVAVHAAREALARGWFPGGVLYAGLRATRGAVDVLAQLLSALSIPSAYIPLDAGKMAQLYAAVLGAYAAQGRRILVLIDNVGSDEQVRPLIPGGGQAVIVSQRPLDQVEAREVRLGLHAQLSRMLPEGLYRDLESAFPERRARAVTELARWPATDDRIRDRAARQALAEIAGSDIPAIADVARECLAARQRVTAGLPRESAPSILILGAPGSGKTTFAAAFDLALTRQQTGFSLVANDEASERLLIIMTQALASRGPLPEAQVDNIEVIDWSLFGQLPPGAPAGLESGRKTGDLVRLGLRLVEAAGEAADVGRTDLRQNLAAYVASSPGIILTFDPVRQFERGDQFATTNSLLKRLVRSAGEAPDFDGRLPHRLAVCVTKFDDRRVLGSAQALGLLTVNPADPLRFPVVTGSENARTLLRQLSGLHPDEDDEQLVSLIEGYFHPERIRYFVTTAIGCHVNPVTRVFDAAEPENVRRDHRGLSLVRGPAYPINVAEPLLWACGLAPAT